MDSQTQTSRQDHQTFFERCAEDIFQETGARTPEELIAALDCHPLYGTFLERSALA